MTTPQPPAGYPTPLAEEGAGALADRSIAWLRRPARPWHHLLFAAALAAILLATCLTGVVPTRGHPADMLFVADGAWRALSGQRPHVDFFSSWGPVTFLLFAGGFSLAQGGMDGVGYSNALAGLMLGVWAYWILLKRAPAAIALGGGLVFAILAVTPVSLGYPFELPSQAMLYNRWSFALTGIVLVECFPMRAEGRERSLAEGFSSGAAAAILLFLKASYFGVAGVFLAMSLLWQGRLELRRIAGLAAGFLVAAIPLLAWIHFDLAAMLSNLRTAAHARSRPVAPVAVAHLFFQNISALAIMAALSAAAGIGAARAGAFHRWKYAVLAAVVFTGGILLLSTNAQPERLPLNEVFALLLAAALLARNLPLPAAGALSMAAVALGMLAYPVGNDVLGILDGLKLKHRYPPAQAYIARVPGFERYVMLDEYANPESPNTGRFIKSYLEDGYALVRREARPGEKIATFDAYNPFPYLLRAAPPSGGLIAAVYNLIYNEQYHPSAADFFGDADIVMFPKTPVEYKVYSDGLEKVYGAALRERFAIAAESPGWWLYRRKP